MIKPPNRQSSTHIGPNAMADFGDAGNLRPNAQSLSAQPLASPMQKITFFAARRSPRPNGSSKHLIEPPQHDVVGISCNGALRFSPPVDTADRLMARAKSTEASLLGAGHYLSRLQKNENRDHERHYTWIDNADSNYRQCAAVTSGKKRKNPDTYRHNFNPIKIL